MQRESYMPRESFDINLCNIAIEITELYLVLLNKQKSSYHQVRELIDEVNCIGLLLALRTENQKAI